MLGFVGEESRHLPETFVHEVASTTHMGLTHVKNQDALAATTWDTVLGPFTLVAVADGVSSGANSEIASRMAIDTLLEQTKRLLGEAYQASEVLSQLVDAAENASRSIAKRPHPSAVTADATTLAAALCTGNQAFGLWAGDSRAYLVRGNGISRLTRDHSWSEAIVSRGLMNEEEASHDPRARMITRWLGPQEHASPGLETFEVSLESDDVLLCCTDGLYMYFSPPHGSLNEISEILHEHKELQAGIEQLERTALERGGHDDISIAALVLRSTA
jgi:PPM family protein phosphatase